MNIKKTLLASAAFVAFASNPAFAFEEVNWVWDSNVTDNINRDINVTIDTSPSGLVQIEKIQTQTGDVTATSAVTGINNNPPGIGEGGLVQIDETMTVTTNYDKPIGIGESTTATGGLVSNDPEGQLTGELLSGTLSEQQNAFTDIIDVQLTGEIALEDIGGINDAVDLPKINSAATAVGNNQSIDSSVSVALHDEQILSGLEGGTAAVTATSTVSDILNATVESAATAVGNNMDVSLTAASVSDAFMVADVSQTSSANISAVSDVTNVTFESYNNFGEASMGPIADVQIPMINSVATAVGNNMSVVVASPTF